jgi:opacity protein-like surface antigen
MQLLRTTAAAVAAGALVVALSGSAMAQDNGISKPFRVKVGGFFPYDSDTQDALGSNFIAFGLGYDIKRVSSFRPATIEAYIDHFDRVRETGSIGRVQATVLGGGLSARFSLHSTPNPNYTPYAGAGLGVFKVNAIDGDTASTTRTSIGGKFFLGTELRNGLFGEAEFNYLPHPSVFGSDQVLSGWQLRLGYRF